MNRIPLPLLLTTAPLALNASKLRAGVADDLEGAWAFLAYAPDPTTLAFLALAVMACILPASARAGRR